LSRVLALTKKAYVLLDKGYMVRAAETLKEAAEAAQAALPDTSCCIILAALRVRLARALWYDARPPDERASSAVVLDPRVVDTLLPAAMTAMEARHAAGTLMPAGCRPAELAWGAVFYRHSFAHQQMTPECLEAVVTLCAPFTGYEAYLMTASLALRTLFALGHDPRVAENAHFAEHMMTFVVSAVDLVAQPRSLIGVNFAFETGLINELSMVASAAANTEQWRPLMAAFQRLHASGVLQQRGVADAIATVSAASAATGADGRCFRCAWAAPLRAALLRRA
jgi:hypothetical protein